ncbi:cell wall-binding repeat-containing protein, partial [Stomatohabitans albus]|uniref:cell wall-binding repeat-containing protein n=1 Tax=Stomatohabitans albus TaxID=3110766 RepID=UPI00300C2285
MPVLSPKFRYLLTALLVASPLVTSPSLVNAQTPTASPSQSPSTAPTTTPSPPAAPSDNAPSTQVPEDIQKPRTNHAISTKRYAGNDRYGTAIAISNTLYRDHSQDTILLASGEQFPDAITAANLFTSGHPNPVLLTPHNKLTPEVETELKRLAKPNATVTIIGGEQALSPELKTAITTLGFKTTRLSGLTRIETALKIASESESKREAHDVVVTPADDVMLSLVGASYALRSNAVHLLAGTAAEQHRLVANHIQTRAPQQSTSLGNIEQIFSPTATVDAIHGDNPLTFQTASCYNNPFCIQPITVAPPGPEAQTITEK